jgi:exonuclease SbcC
MRVSRLKIDSLFGVEHIELDGKNYELSGKKGTGKTSVIDAIRFALQNSSTRKYIVKQGNHSGHILIETDNGIFINRKASDEGGSTVKVTEHGKTVKAPQSFLNDIFTSLQLSPIEFAGLTDKEQNKILLGLIEYDWTIDTIKEWFGEVPGWVNYEQHILQVLHDIQDDDGFYYKQRHAYNKEELYKRQTAQDVAAKLPEKYSYAVWEKYDLTGKIAELHRIQKANSEIDRAKAFIEAYNNKVRGLEAERDISISSEEKAISTEREGLLSTKERLKAELKAIDDTLLTLDDKLNDKKMIAVAQFNEAVAKLEKDSTVAKEYANKTKLPTAELQGEVDHASKMKEFVSEAKSLEKMIDECKELTEKSNELTEKIELARRLPGIVLETATIPIEGLSVADGQVLINNLPVSNLSTGERISLCVDITLARENNLKLILLDGMESLDEESRRDVYAKCKAAGVQIIATVTDNSHELQIVELNA